MGPDHGREPEGDVVDVQARRTGHARTGLGSDRVRVVNRCNGIGDPPRRLQDLQGWGQRPRAPPGDQQCPLRDSRQRHHAGTDRHAHGSGFRRQRERHPTGATGAGAGRPRPTRTSGARLGTSRRPHCSWPRTRPRSSRVRSCRWTAVRRASSARARAASGNACRVRRWRQSGDLRRPRSGSRSTGRGRRSHSGPPRSRRASCSRGVGRRGAAASGGRGCRRRRRRRVRRAG